MKQYGFNKATEFTKKQIGVIYANAKNGNLKVEKWVISEFYNLADYYGYDSNRSIEQSESYIMRILKAIFEKDLEYAQKLIDIYTTSNFELKARKFRESADRSFL